MGYTSLKAALDAYVKTNGSQSITGAGLNNVMTQLLQGVDILERTNPADTTGMNKIVLDKTKTFAEQVVTANTTYEIRDNFTLAADFSIPNNSVLLFMGGSIDGAYTLNLNNCQILGTNRCFGSSLIISGKTTSPAFVDWFADSEDYVKIQKALQFFGTATLNAREYTINSAIEVGESFALFGYGFGDAFGISTDQYKTNRSASILRASAQLGGNANDCILKLTGANMSCTIVGVSFMPTFGQNEGMVNGIYSSSVSGPARPVVIDRCNFKYLNSGIYINKSGGSNTGVMLSVHDCNISRNNYGIRADGVHTIVDSSIRNNNLEQNNTAGIYFGDSSDDVCIYGAVTIDGNMLEGQDLPIFISCGIYTSLEIKNNYFERSAGIQYIKLIGKTGITPVIFTGNSCSSNLTYLAVYARLVKLYSRDNYLNGKTIVYGSFAINRNNDCEIYNKKKQTTIVLASGEEDHCCSIQDSGDAVDNTSTPSYSLAPAPNAVVGGKLMTKREYGTSTTIAFKSQSIEAGDYLAVFAVHVPQGILAMDGIPGVRFRVRQSSVDLFFQYMIIFREGKTFCVVKFTAPSTGTCTFYVLNNASNFANIYCSNVDLYALTNNLVIPNKESYSDDTSALVLTSKETGLFRMNAGKPNWWNGTAWVDATGTPV